MKQREPPRCAINSSSHMQILKTRSILTSSDAGWRAADQTPLGIAQVKEWMLRDAKWHGHPWSESYQVEELRWESRPPTSNAKGLRLFSEMTLASSKAMELLEFSVLWIKDWILLIFIFILPDTMHLSSSFLLSGPNPPACLCTLWRGWSPDLLGL